MSTATKTTEAQDLAPVSTESLAALLLTAERPARPSALSTSLTFGWRAVLKIKHVPEQLFDVTAFPIMMVLMYTYLFGGALAGSPEEYIQFLLPGILVMSVVMITMYTGVSVNTDIEKASSTGSARCPSGGRRRWSAISSATCCATRSRPS